MRDPGERYAVAKFALSGLVAMALVGVATFFVMREHRHRPGDRQRQAGRQGCRPGDRRAAGGPAASWPGGRRASRRSIASSRSACSAAHVVRVKIWTPDGRIVYSDEPRLIGSATGSAPTRAPRSASGARRGRRQRPLRAREPIRAAASASSSRSTWRSRSPNGKPLLFETYQRFSSVASSGSDIWLAFAPALLGALILLELIQVPLASSMAKRLRRGHREREELLQRAFEAPSSSAGGSPPTSTTGSSSSSPAPRSRWPRPRSAWTARRDGGAATALRRGSAQTRQSVRELRSLLAEIYPAVAARGRARAGALGPAGAGRGAGHRDEPRGRTRRLRARQHRRRRWAGQHRRRLRRRRTDRSAAAVEDAGPRHTAAGRARAADGRGRPPLPADRTRPAGRPHLAHHAPRPAASGPARLPAVTGGDPAPTRARRLGQNIAIVAVVLAAIVLVATVVAALSHPKHRPTTQSPNPRRSRRRSATATPPAGRPRSTRTRPACGRRPATRRRRGAPTCTRSRWWRSGR